MNEYKEYIKPSIPWISKIPSHWKVIRGKNLYKKMQRPVYSNDEVVTCFRDGTVTLRKNRRTTGFTESLKEIGYQGIRKGDLVIHVMDAFAGAIGVSDSDGKGTPVYSVCQAKGNSNNQYYAHLLRIMAQKGFIQSLYRGIRERSSDFRFEVFASQFYPVPPRAEQDQIVRFLDWKVSSINKLIATKKKQISLLEDIKQSKINTIISTLSKDNTICRRLKSIATCNQLSLDETTPLNYKFRYVDIGSVDAKYGITHYEKMSFEQSPSRARRIVHKNDIIVSTVRTYLRAITKIEDDKDVIVSTGFAVITPKNVDSKYLEYCFKSDLFCNEVISKSIGIAYPAINTSKLMCISIPVPNINLQFDISKKLDNKCKIINKSIECKKTQIETLKALKTRLISDVVTGKIDVRDIEIPDYEFVAEEQTESSADIEQIEEQED